MLMFLEDYMGEFRFAQGELGFTQGESRTSCSRGVLILFYKVRWRSDSRDKAALIMPSEKEARPSMGGQRPGVVILKFEL